MGTGRAEKAPPGFFLCGDHGSVERHSVECSAIERARTPAIKRALQALLRSFGSRGHGRPVKAQIATASTVRENRVAISGGGLAVPGLSDWARASCISSRARAASDSGTSSLKPPRACMRCQAFEP